MVGSQRRRDPGTLWTFAILGLLYVVWYQGMGHAREALELGELTREVPSYAEKVKEGAADAGLTFVASPYEMSAAAQAGSRVYEHYCIGCHGVTGAGDGPAAEFLEPKPRNFQTGVIKFISSQPNTLPMREDLLRTITHGLPGSSMPSFRLLPERDRENLVEFILHWIKSARYWRFYSQLMAEGLGEAEADDPDYRFTQETVAEIEADNAEVLAIAEGVKVFPETSEPALDEDGLVIGAQKYSQYCASCHKPGGEGGLMENAGEPTFNDFGELSIARNLHRGDTYRHGTDALSLWYRIKRGLEGAVMPGASNWSSDEAWHVAHYTQLLFDAELQSKYDLAAIREQAGLTPGGAPKNED